MPAAILISPVVDSSANAAGSELDIVELRVAEAIAGLIDRVRASAAGDDWVEYHNRLTALVIIAAMIVLTAICAFLFARIRKAAALLLLPYLAWLLFAAFLNYEVIRLNPGAENLVPEAGSADIAL